MRPVFEPDPGALGRVTWIEERLQPPEGHPQSRRCIEDSEDPGDIGALMPGGIDGGDCLQTHRERSLVAVERADSAADVLVLANFQHDGRFWIARIPRNVRVQEVFFQREWFVPEFAHLETVFVLDPSTPVQLLPQPGHSTSDAKPSLALERVLLSGEAIWSRERGYRRGALWSLMPFFYGLVHRITSPEQRMSEYDGRQLDKIHLLLEPADRAAFFRRTIETSVSEGLSQMFDPLRRSCATVPLAHLDHVLWPSYAETTRRRLRRSRRLNPSEIERYLDWRGISYEPARPFKPQPGVMHSDETPP